MGAGSLRGLQQSGLHGFGIRNDGGVTPGKFHRDMTPESKNIIHDSYSPRNTSILIYRSCASRVI